MSAVMRRRLLTISAIRFGEIPIASRAGSATADTPPELILEHLAGSDRCKRVLSHHRLLLVTVHDLEVVSFAIDPSEDHPPLIVDTDRMKVLQVALEFHQAPRAT